MLLECQKMISGLGKYCCDKIKQNINQTSYFRPKYLKNNIIVSLSYIIVKGVTNPV
jgi:hypothetical protein